MINRNNFKLVEYNNIPYPASYSAEIKEIAAHFDKGEIEIADQYSLHTEYSYGKRKFDSALLTSFPEVVASHKDGIPQLWKSDKWALEFAEFILTLTKDRNPPSVIEIHPPFNDYCTFDDFAERYCVFEKRIHSVYPETVIVIENRAGTVYRGGRFLVGRASEIADLCECIKQNSLNLGIVLDFPQLLTAENIDPLKFKAEKYQAAINAILPYRDLIKGIHIWGKKKSATGRWVAHAGNLNTYFDCNTRTKDLFLSGIYQICNDEHVRFLVPEVNTGPDDLADIIHDLNTIFRR